MSERRICSRLPRRQLLVLIGAGLMVGAGACAAPSPTPSAPTAAAPSPATAVPAAPKAAPTAVPTTAPAAAKPTSPPKPAGLPRLATPVGWKDGFPPIPAFAWVQHIASAEGIYRDLGLNVETTVLGGDIAALRAILANELQSGIFTLTATLVSIAQGSSVKIIGSPMPKLPHVLFVSKDINSVQDLKGKNWGIAGQGGLSHVLMLTVLDQEKISDKDVNFVDITQGGAIALFQALVQGKLQAVAAPIDYQLNLKPEDNVKVLLSFRERVPGLVRGCVTSERMIKEQPEAVARLIGGQVLATRFLLENRDKAIDILVKVANQERDIVAWTYDKYVEFKLFDPNYQLEASSIAFMQQLNIKLGMQDKEFPVDKALDLSIQKRVIEALREYKKS